MGEGNKKTHIKGKAVNSGANDCIINLGGGSNFLSMDYTYAQRDLNILDHASIKDQIFLNGGNVGRYLYLQTGSGDDSVNLSEMNIGSQLNIQTGAGNDQVYLGGGNAPNSPTFITAGSVYVDLGAGNDTLVLGGFGNNDSKTGGGVVTKQATYLGGTGVDQVMNESGEALFGSFTAFEATSHFIKK